MLACEWKGNVRELKNIVERGFYLSSGAFIDSLEMLMAETETVVPDHDSETLKELEKNSIEHALFQNHGNVVKAAEDLSISKATIYRKIKAYDIHISGV